MGYEKPATVPKDAQTLAKQSTESSAKQLAVCMMYKTHHVALLQHTMDENVISL